VLHSWEHFANELSWGETAGALPEPGRWWWELRPHVRYGTLEVRVPDAQPSLEAAGAIVSTIHALASHLTVQFHEGADLRVAPTWRIAENRWRALRDGVHGHFIDLETGEVEPGIGRISRLLQTIEDHAPDGLDPARRLLHDPTVDRLRLVGVDGAMAYLAEQFLPVDTIAETAIGQCRS